MEGLTGWRRGGEGTGWRGKLDVCMWWPGMATQHCVPCRQRQKSANQTLSQLVRLDAEAVFLLPCFNIDVGRANWHWLTAHDAGVGRELDFSSKCLIFCQAPTLPAMAEAFCTPAQCRVGQ